jgi:hypothetical protein
MYPSCGIPDAKSLQAATTAALSFGISRPSAYGTGPFGETEVFSRPLLVSQLEAYDNRLKVRAMYARMAVSVVGASQSSWTVTSN